MYAITTPTTAAAAAVAAEYLAALELYEQTRTQLAPVRAEYSQQLRDNPDKYPPHDLASQLDAMEHGAELLRRRLVDSAAKALALNLITWAEYKEATQP